MRRFFFQKPIRYCRYCGAVIPPGAPAKQIYCRGACRQADYRKRLKTKDER